MASLTSGELQEWGITEEQFQRLPKYAQTTITRLIAKQSDQAKKLAVHEGHVTSRIAYEELGPGGRFRDIYIPARWVRMYPWQDGDQPHYYGSYRPYIDAYVVDKGVDRPHVKLMGSDSIAVKPEASNSLTVSLDRR